MDLMDAQEFTLWIALLTVVEPHEKQQAEARSR